MRNLLQLGVLSLCLTTAFPALAQSRIGIGVAVNLGVAQTTPTIKHVDPINARRTDPIVFVDRVISGPASEAIFHLSVYATGLASISRGSFPSDGDQSATSEEVDFAFVGTEEAAALRKDLFAAGAARLNGPFRGFGQLTSFTRDTQVTFFTPPRSLRPSPLRANSYSYGIDILDPTVLRVEAVLEAFILEHFPGFSHTPVATVGSAGSSSGPFLSFQRQ